MAGVIPFLTYLLFPSNPTLPLNQKKIYFTPNKQNNIRNIVLVLKFQQLLANNHNRLRDSKFGREEVWVWSPTKQRKNK